MRGAGRLVLVRAAADSLRGWTQTRRHPSRVLCLLPPFPAATNTHPSCPLGLSLILLPSSLPPRLLVQAMRTRTERRLAAARADFMPGRQAKLPPFPTRTSATPWQTRTQHEGQKELANNAQVLVRVGRPPLRRR